MSVLMGGLAKRLVFENLISESVAIAAIQMAAKRKQPFVTQLVADNSLDGSAIAVAAAQEFGVPLLDLDSYDFTHIPRKLVDKKLIKQHNVLPLFRRANRLHLAVSDPGNIAAFDEIKFHTGINNDVVVVEEEKLALAIADYINHEELQSGSITELDADALEELNVEILPVDSPEQETSTADEAPIVKFVNKILLDAIRTGASDIHIEPYEKTYRYKTYKTA